MKRTADISGLATVVACAVLAAVLTVDTVPWVLWVFVALVWALVAHYFWSSAQAPQSPGAWLGLVCGGLAMCAFWALLDHWLQTDRAGMAWDAIVAVSLAVTGVAGAVRSWVLGAQPQPVKSTMT